jgi:signal transduction histidine kinase
MKLHWLWIDIATAVVLLVLLEVAHMTDHVGTATLVTAIALVPFVLLVALRRRWPLAALLTAITVALVQALMNGSLLNSLNGDQVVILLLAYGAGTWLEPRRAYIALICALVLALAWAFMPVNGGPPTGGAAVEAVLYVTALLVPVWYVGFLVHRNAQRARDFAEIADWTRARSREEIDAAVASERERISGELHDIIAHSVSAMVVQAGSARLLARTDPDQARDSMLAIERIGHSTLTDLRLLVGMLRREGAA